MNLVWTPDKFTFVPSPLRIAFTIAGLHPESGGPSQSVPALVDALAEAGAAIDVFTLDLGGGFKPSLLPRSSRVQSHLIPCRGAVARRLRYTPKFARALEEHCRQKAVDVIHDTGLWLPTNHSAATIARRLGIPLVISPRGMLTPWALGYRKWKKAVAWKLFQKRDLHSAALLHATSDQEADGFRQLGLKQPIAIIPNGVELAPSAPRQNKETGLRTALFLSRLHPKKGLIHLIEAWAQLRPEGWRVLIAGEAEDGYQAVLEQAVAQHRVQDFFRFLGPLYHREKWEAYRDSHLFILPSHSENFGLAIAEALGAGLPVITTRGTPWAELETHSCGWWIEPGTRPLVEALQEALAMSDAQRSDMGARGRALVERKYSWKTLAEQMMEDLTKVSLESPARPKRRPS